MEKMTRATMGGFLGVRKVAIRAEQRVRNADWSVALTMALCMVEWKSTAYDRSRPEELELINKGCVTTSCYMWSSKPTAKSTISKSWQPSFEKYEYG